MCRQAGKLPSVEEKSTTGVSTDTGCAREGDQEAVQDGVHSCIQLSQLKPHFTGDIVNLENSGFYWEAVCWYM